MRRRSSALTGLAIVFAALWAAAPASADPAGTVTRVGTTIHVDFGEALSTDSLFVQTPAFNTIELQENSFGPGTLTDAAADCTQTTGDIVTCTVAGADRLVIHMGPGGDFSEFLTWTVTAVHVELHGDEGDDSQLWGTGLDDTIDGGPGDDELDGFAGDDAIDGGAGDDVLSGQGETDDIRGGTGFDTIDFSGAATNVTVTLDDVPGDGPAGDGDNIHSDVEDIFGTVGNDVITGSPGGNIIDGGGGDDVLNGGGGVDILRGGDGNDALLSRDGLAELVECGEGADSLVADDVDVSDGCESEQRSGALQTDVDGDGAARPADCDDGDAAIRPGATDLPGDGIDQNCDGADAVPDSDADGFPRGIDCDDANPRAHPGARERRGNRADEDCNGRAEPYALVTNGVPNAWLTQGSITRNLKLGVRDVRKGMKIELRCRGGGCPFARKSRNVARRKRLLDLHPLLGSAGLRPGAVLELRIKRRGAIGKVVRYSVRSGAVPQSRVLCLRPGAKRAREC
jgi:hypothetical protein